MKFMKFHVKDQLNYSPRVLPLSWNSQSGRMDMDPELLHSLP